MRTSRYNAVDDNGDTYLDRVDMFLDEEEDFQSFVNYLQGYERTDTMRVAWGRDPDNFSILFGNKKESDAFLEYLEQYDFTKNAPKKSKSKKSSGKKGKKKGKKK